MVKAAAVYDIYSDVPRSTDRLFVDTNVWIAVTYTKASISASGKSTIYSSYLEKCLQAQAQLLWSTLSFSEIAHVIEEAEYRLYNDVSNQICTKKQFRLGTAERSLVVDEVEGAWQQVTAMGKGMTTPIDEAALDRALHLFKEHPLDGYDIFYYNAMKAAGVLSIITDDIDFIYLPDVHVFTANAKALEQARSFNKLRRR